MTELVHLLEYISIDVVLIGLVFSVFLMLSHSIWKHRHLGVGPAVSEGLDGMRRFAEEPRVSWVHPVAMVVLASQIGTVLVRLSDEILDSNAAIEAPIFLYVPEIGNISEWSSWFADEWEEEDELKLRVIEDGLERADFSAEVKGLLRRHLPPPEGSCFPPKGTDDCAKGFFQHANAVVLSDRGGDEQREELRREKYTVYLLSVLFVGTWIVVLATLAGPMLVAVCSSRAGILKAWTGHGIRALAPLGKVFLALLLLWVAEGFILRLWTEQSVRYNRRLLHAYVEIASYGDAAMDIAPAAPVEQTNED